MSQFRLPLRIVVVDDDPRLCQLLVAYLESQGHVAEWLNDPSQLLSWLDLNPRCDAMILDIDMVPTSGLDILPTIHSAYPNLPVLIYTGAGFDEEKMEKARRLGASGYVSKGLPIADMYVAVMRVVTQAHKKASV